MEKSKTSVCRELVSKTRSKVNAPAASLDCCSSQSMQPKYILEGIRRDTQALSYVNAASVFCLEVYDRLSSACKLGFVGRSESRNHWTRKDQSR